MKVPLSADDSGGYTGNLAAHADPELAQTSEEPAVRGSPQSSAPTYILGMLKTRDM